VDADYTLQTRAITWFAAHAHGGWASSPITQNGCVRIMSHPGYPNALPVRAIMERLTHACSSALHEFWPDEVSLLDAALVDAARIHGPRQLSDVYLLALAVQRGGCFATLDTSVALTAVKGARKNHLLIL
jgi:predicted nucleic acid-binding protein